MKKEKRIKIKINKMSRYVLPSYLEKKVRLSSRLIYLGYEVNKNLQLAYQNPVLFDEDVDPIKFIGNNLTNRYKKTEIDTYFRDVALYEIDKNINEMFDLILEIDKMKH